MMDFAKKKNLFKSMDSDSNIGSSDNSISKNTFEGSNDVDKVDEKNNSLNSSQTDETDSKVSLALYTSSKKSRIGIRVSNQDSDNLKKINWDELMPNSRVNKFLLIIPFILFCIIIGWLVSSLWGNSGNQDNNVVQYQSVVISDQFNSINNITYKKNIDQVDYNKCKIDNSSMLVTNISTGQVYFSFNSDRNRQIASLTKLVTAIVAYNNYDSEKLLTVKDVHNYEGSQLDLKNGEFLRVDDLITALVVYSANDAAYILADNFEGGFDGFVEKMNTLSKDLNLKDSRFANPTGFDDDRNYMSANDIAVILSVFLNNKYLKDKLELRNVEIPIYSKDGRIIRTISLQNRNELLLEYIVDGGKTGYTDIAKSCLASYVETDAGRIVYIVLGVEDRFKSTKCLLGLDYSDEEN